MKEKKSLKVTLTLVISLLAESTKLTLTMISVLKSISNARLTTFRCTTTTQRTLQRALESVRTRFHLKI